MSKSDKTPWTIEAVRKYAEEIDRLSGLWDATLTGLVVLARGSSPAKMAELSDGDARLLRKRIGIAKAEVDSEFSAINTWVVVWLWAHLEATMRALLSAFLRNDASAWESDKIKKLSINIRDYNLVDSEHRMDYLVEQLERNKDGKSGKGISHFENLLGLLGLSGHVPAGLGTVLFELGQIRNVIAHNAGHIDRQFLVSCPWHAGRVGDRVLVTTAMVDEFLHAGSAYLHAVMDRMGARFDPGATRPPTRATNLEKRLKVIRELTLNRRGKLYDAGESAES